MPIILPEGLPAIGTLSLEGVSVIPSSDAASHASAVRIALVNLMPTKTATEIQFSRHLAASHDTVHLDLVVPDSYYSRTTTGAYIDQFYTRWSQAEKNTYDGMIVTGAPIEHLPYDRVRYWDDMTRIFDWAQENIPSSYYVCWAAQAAMWHFHGVPKHDLHRKMFGVFPHSVAASCHPLLKGLEGTLPVPVSRHTAVRYGDLPKNKGLEVLLDSHLSGLGLIDDPRNNAIYMFNHLEYDAGTLGAEYRRDVKAGRSIDLPRNYFPGDDPNQMPVNYWRSGSRQFYSNWVRMLDLARRDRAHGIAA